MGNGPTPTDSYDKCDNNEFAGSLQNDVKDFKKVDSLSIGVVNAQMKQPVKIRKAENNEARECGDFGLVMRTHDDFA